MGVSQGLLGGWPIFGILSGFVGFCLLRLYVILLGLSEICSEIPYVSWETFRLEWV